MVDFKEAPKLELIYIIADYGLGSRILQKAKQHGILGGTVLLGKGTVNNYLSNLLSLYDERKEIVLMGTDSSTCEHVLTELNEKFQFDKPNNGIVFTTDLCKIVGTSCFGNSKNKDERGVNNSMYQIITTIVDRGKAEDVIEAAKVAGSKGGTIINARGSGVHETSKLFNMEIEPEKEIVLILSKKDVTKNIVSSIRENLKIDEPGKGIMFIQDTNITYGIYE